MDYTQVKNDEHDYLMPTYGRFDAVLTHGKGAAAYGADEKEYIDFTSGIGVNALGYSDDGWVKAVTGQALKIQHISNLYYSPVQTQLAKALCEKTGFDKVFFTNSGAEANECAIKLARKYSFETFDPSRTSIVCLKNSFHGRTITTLSATGQDVFHNYFFPFTGGFTFAEANDFESVKASVNEETCAVMIELIQGEGGICPLEQEFVLNLYDFCRENALLLIVDEVQTGMGRTGKLYCYENYGIMPDIVTAAKGLGGGLPIGACLCSKELGGVLSAGTHGTTYGGNPIGMRRRFGSAVPCRKRRVFKRGTAKGRIHKREAFEDGQRKRSARNGNDARYRARKRRSKRNRRQMRTKRAFNPDSKGAAAPAAAAYHYI